MRWQGIDAATATVGRLLKTALPAIAVCVTVIGAGLNSWWIAAPGIALFGLAALLHT